MTTPRSSALAALALLVPVPTIGVLAAMWVFPGIVGQAVYALSKAWIILLPAVWFLKVDRGRPGWVAPDASLVRAGLWIGLAISVAIGGAWWLWGSWIDADRLRATAQRVGIGTPARYAGLAVYLCTVNALAEEYVWRWFVYGKCRALVSGPAAVWLSALLFTVHHVFALAAQMPWSVVLLGSLGVFAGGAVWSWCYGRYGSIWPGYVSHVVADVTIFWIGWTVLF